MLESGLNSEIEHGKEKLSAATKAKAAAEETQSKAEGDLAETSKTKAADEEYSTNLKTECEETATSWADRQKSAKEEMAAIEKAKEILVSGVTAFSQVSMKNRRASDLRADGLDDREEADDVRVRLAQKFQ